VILAATSGAVNVRLGGGSVVMWMVLLALLTLARLLG
jgi:hypothetical protein